MFDFRQKLLYCTYILTLGLVRLTFATGNLTFLPWVALVLTHVIECYLWWSLALAPTFNKDSLSAVELAKEAVTLNLPGGFQTALQLVGVPVLIVLFLILGPRKATNKAPSKSS